MVSQHRNHGRTPPNAIPVDQILDAAYDLLVSRGMRKMTMADVARQAGVSRATMYRRWSGVKELVAALMTREWSDFAPHLDELGGRDVRSVLVDECLQTVRGFRVHPMMRALIELDPEVLQPYIFERRGRSNEGQLRLLEAAISAGQRDGSVRAGDVEVLAQTVFLAGLSFVFTAPAYARDPRQLAAIDDELRLMLDRFLAP